MDGGGGGVMSLVGGGGGAVEMASRSTGGTYSHIKNSQKVIHKDKNR